MTALTALRGRLSAFETISPVDWQGLAVPERRWLVPGFLLRGTVTLLSGDGGIGKSLLTQQLLTALATGRSFLGLPAAPRPIRSLALFCEDDADELHFRQHRINAHYGCDMRDLEPITLVTRVGLDNLLVAFDRRTDEGEETALYHQMETMIRQSGTELIIVDTAADTFGGNENVRPQVLRFVNALRRLARINDGGVLLNAHPSVAGLMSGSGMSGSTAWNNTVRGRLYLKRPTVEETADSDARILELMKSNQGRSGEQIRLRWREHVFELDGDRTAGRDSVVERIEIDSAVLAGLRKLVASGALVSADPDAKTGLANKVRRLPACRQWSWQAVIAAQERLTVAGRIETVEMGPPSKRRIYVRPHDMRLPGEVCVGSAGA